MAEAQRKKKANFELSAGAVIFFENDGREYLLLKYESGNDYWGFPKGRVERKKKESLAGAALREIKEETGLGRNDVVLAPDFKEREHYFFKKDGVLISKEVVFFLARAKTKNVTVSWEHTGFEWLPYPAALERLKYKNHKELLKKAEAYLDAGAKHN